MNVKLTHCPLCGDVLNTIFADDGIILRDDMKCVRCRLVWRIQFASLAVAGEIEVLGFNYAGLS